MPGNKAAIKSRIKSINATKKITGAMNLISNVKLQKEKAKLERRQAYTEELRKVVEKVFNSDHNFDHAYFHENDTNKKYVLFISSDLGMCGAYNSNLIKFLKENVSNEDYLYVIGSHSYKSIVNEGFNVVNEMVSSESLDYFDLKEIADETIRLFLNKEIKEIDIIYTKFVNTVTFECECLRILPAYLDLEEEHKEFIYLEPKPLDVIETLVPMMVRNIFYSKYIEAKTAEQASRRLAMENATDNAEELVEKLTLQYNQARQAAITQEITEIVSGADAL